MILIECTDPLRLINYRYFLVFTHTDLDRQDHAIQGVHDVPIQGLGPVRLRHHEAALEAAVVVLAVHAAVLEVAQCHEALGHGRLPPNLRHREENRLSHRNAINERKTSVIDHRAVSVQLEVFGTVIKNTAVMSHGVKQP